jgi:hypothetical protein
MQEMEKKIKLKRIFQTGKRASQWESPYTWGEVKELLAEENIELQDDDVLEVGYTEGYDHGDSSREAYYDISVTRPRQETDEEFEKRKADREYVIQKGLEQRRKTYEELKKEFEG